MLFLKLWSWDVPSKKKGGIYSNSYIKYKNSSHIKQEIIKKKITVSQPVSLCVCLFFSLIVIFLCNK